MTDLDDGPPPTPVWVKAGAAVVLLLLVTFLVLHLTGNAPTGGHGP